MASMHYEWDEEKAQRNAAKHGVTFDEARTVFDDADFISLIDDEHSQDEERYITIGRSIGGRLLLVAHTERDNRIRIISAREATRREQRFYAEAE